MEEYQKAKAIFFYCSKAPEVSTPFLIQHALRSGKKVGLPLSLQNGQIETYFIRSLEEDVKEGSFGILEPIIPKTSKASQSSFDFFVIPGIAFDLAGNRMGWGQGYFDRYLERIGTSQVKLALAYEIQICDALCPEPHDQRIDIVVTEKRVIRLGVKS